MNDSDRVSRLFDGFDDLKWDVPILDDAFKPTSLLGRRIELKVVSRVGDLLVFSAVAAAIIVFKRLQR